MPLRESSHDHDFAQFQDSWVQTLQEQEALKASPTAGNGAPLSMTNVRISTLLEMSNLCSRSYLGADIDYHGEPAN